MAKKYLWDEVPWLTMLPVEDRPRVVACSQFGWLMSAALNPPDMSTATPEQRLRNAARFCIALQTLGGGRWVWIEERRGALPGVKIPAPANRAAQLFVKDRMSVHGAGVHSASRHYVSVRHSPPTGLAMRIRNALLLPEPGETRGDYGPEFDDFVRSFDRMTSLMKFLGAKPLEGDDLATYLRSTISVNDAPISVDPYEFLAPQLIDSPLYGGKQLWLGHEGRRLNVRSVQINTYPYRLQAGALDFGDDTFAGLTELGYRIRRVKRIRTQSKTESVRELEWLVKKAAMTQESMLLNVLKQFQKDASSPLENKAAVVTLQEADEMLTNLQRDGVLRCQTTDNIFVYHEDPVEAKKQAHKIEEFLIGRGFGCEVNDTSNHECVLGAIPGKTDVDFVRPGVNLMAASVSAPLTKAWEGDLRSKTSPILAYGTTSGTSRFALSLHINGTTLHGFLCGGTGGGKTSGLNTLGIGHLIAVPNGRVIRVESGRSGYVLAKLLGGVTFNLGAPGNAVQPLRIIDKPNDRAWAHGWIMARIRGQLGPRADEPSITQAVETALRIMASMPPDERTMTTFCLTVPNEDAALGMRLYSSEGNLGYIFDGVDHRSYDADWINFELSAITEDHEAIAAPALIGYLWRFIMRMSSSKRPIMLQLDEASSYVEGGFVAGLEIGLRKYRKLKTQVVFATQSILDLANSSISHIILNSCPTQIFVQDTAVATPKGVAILNTLGLTEDDAQVITGMDQAGEYFIHRPRAGKAVVTFDLKSPIGSRTVLMTDDDHYRLAIPVEARAKRNDTEFLDEWMAEAGIDVAENLNETVFDDDPIRIAAE
jgi:type IV secretion system protein TrbE